MFVVLVLRMTKSLVWAAMLSSTVLPAMAADAPEPQSTTAVDMQGIHGAPILIKAHQLKALANFPLSYYRVFKTDANGVAVPIPFQIDEMNEWGDYVLDIGDKIKTDYSVGNGIFDQIDELAIMGDDVGLPKPPTKWAFEKPSQLHELKFDYTGSDASTQPKLGAVYIGIYMRRPPALSKKWYVKFDLKEAQVVTDRYRYKFNKDNYLVVRGVEVARKEGAGGEYSYTPLLDSSTFYLNIDMKFFLSMEIGAYDVTSSLEAYKMGPIRTIVRVAFNYELLKLKFDLGMYTEVSFFANAVFLPAIFYNPLNGPKSLNRGSGFYYGFSLIDNPQALDVKTNLGKYSGAAEAKNPGASEPFYWISARGKEEFFYLRLTPSQQMRKIGYMPSFYVEDKGSKELDTRKKNTAQPLGKSPVNLAMYFDLTQFDEGEHLMTFQLYFENKQNEKLVRSIKDLHLWSASALRINQF